MNNKEEYLNQIELLKQALRFYANKENYVEHPVTHHSMIENDNGHQARFALKQLTKVEGINQEMNEEYLKEVSKEMEKSNTPENIMKLIKEIKNVGDGNV